MLYGATGGEAFIRGVAGERFCVRNSGANAVVEGTGDHCAEYMTGGRIIVLGKVGRNFAAGMSGGIAYVLNVDGNFAYFCNVAMVELNPVLDQDDQDFIRTWLRKHVNYTGSAVAGAVLANWHDYLPKFMRVHAAGIQACARRTEAPGHRQAVSLHPGRSAVGGSILMGNPKGFMTVKRVENGYRPVTERIRDYAEVETLLPEAERKLQASRCMDCGVPFCHWACPVANIMPEWQDKIYQGDWKAAYEILQDTNNFPEFTGRICPAPCESACVLAINDDSVTIRDNELAVIERAFAEGYVQPRPPERRTGKRVAVIGSGPAGLACADILNKAGHTVTLYEAADQVGGFLRYGVPDFKLEKHMIDRRVNILLEEGLTHPNRRAGRARHLGRGDPARL